MVEPVEHELQSGATRSLWLEMEEEPVKTVLGQGPRQETQTANSGRRRDTQMMDGEGPEEQPCDQRSPEREGYQGMNVRTRF